MIAPVLHRPQFLHASLVEQGRVGQHGGRTVLERVLQNALHLAVHERLAAGEVVFADVHVGRFFQRRAHHVARHEPERVIVGRARDEAVVATQVAHRAAYLEPQLVERQEGD